MNPKDAIACKKVPMSVVPANVLLQQALGMLEGALKYGRHNYRVVPIRSSVYYDATLRHLMAWWEGEDIDEVSGLHHITKALSSLTVLRDAQMQGTEIDDRPPKHTSMCVLVANAVAETMINGIDEPVPPYTELNQEAASEDDTD